MGRQALVIGTALALACGTAGPAGSSRSATDEAGNTTGGSDGGSNNNPSGGGGSNSSPVPCNGKLAVRLAGVNAGAQELDLRLVGVALQGRSGALTPDFTRSGELFAPGDDRLAIVKTPTGEVDVTVRVDRVSMCTGGTCTDLTTCASPIQFQFDAAKVSPNRCHVVAQLDVANSVQSGPNGALFFQPRFSVHY
jgi:hypothetical protein